MDTDGNSVDISDRYDSDGNWVSGSESLIGLQLKHNPGDLVTWTADENLVMKGFDIRLFGSGMTIKNGGADVTFSNGKESFQKYFDVQSRDSGGLFLNAGTSYTRTLYSRVFPSGKNKNDVQNSFLGYFETLGASASIYKSIGVEGGETYGVDNNFKRHENSWSGITNGAGMGQGKGLLGKLSINLGLTRTWYSDPDRDITGMDIWGFPNAER